MASVASSNTVKVVLLGDSGVGKSSLALRFAKDVFRPYCESTIGACFMSKTVNVHVDDGESELIEEGAPTEKKKTKAVEFKIWDTAGQEKYYSLAPMYYRGAGAAILVFDICRRATFAVLQMWVDEIKEKGPPGIVFVVCGNKSDLASHRQVQIDEGEAFATKIKAFYIEVSAKDDQNVRALFAAVAKRVVIEDESDEIQRAEDGRTETFNLALRPRISMPPCCR